MLVYVLSSLVALLVAVFLAVYFIFFSFILYSHGQPVSGLAFVRSFIRASFASVSLLLVPVVDKMGQWRDGYSLKEMSSLKYCHDVSVPVLYMQIKMDLWTELCDIKGFYAETTYSKELWRIEEEIGHFDTYNYIGDNPEKVINFLKQHL
jgi:uncharacterized membrane protein